MIIFETLFRVRLRPRFFTSVVHKSVALCALVLGITLAPTVVQEIGRAHV